VSEISATIYYAVHLQIFVVLALLASVFTTQPIPPLLGEEDNSSGMFHREFCPLSISLED
jgi:hypothetical protein